MGLLDKLFGGARGKGTDSTAGFQTATEHRPVFSAWNNDMYQQQLVRATIERIAMACAKLEPKMVGSAQPRIARAIATSPNQFMTWPKFLARCATIYYNENNLFVVPVYASGTDIVNGVYPLKPAHTEVVDYGGEPWYRFYLANGQTMAIECASVCLLTRFQYKSDYFGSRNILDSTLNLMHAQEKAQEQAIENGASIRFIAKANGQVREEDLKAKIERFSEDYLSLDNNSTSVAAYDQTLEEVKQIDPKSWTIGSDEMKRIREDVFFYFGMNESILTNNYGEDQWSAFYEGVIEPFAIQLGEGLSHMLFTVRERQRNRIEFSANRLQYSSNATKRNMARDMGNMGVLTINDIRQMLQMPPLEDGDVVVIRGEYKVGHTLEEIFEAQKALVEAASSATESLEWADIDRDGQDADLNRGDSEGYGHGDDFDTGTGGRRAD